MTARRRSRPGNDHHQVALVGLAFLVVQPAARPGEVEIGPPVERQVADQGLLRPCPLASIGPPVVGEQVIAQRLQVAVVVRQQRLGDRVADAVGVVLVDELAFGQEGDRLPVGDLEGAPGRLCRRSAPRAAAGRCAAAGRRRFQMAVAAASAQAWPALESAACSGSGLQPVLQGRRAWASVSSWRASERGSGRSPSSCQAFEQLADVERRSGDGAWPCLEKLHGRPGAARAAGGAATARRAGPGSGGRRGRRSGSPAERPAGRPACSVSGEQIGDQRPVPVDLVHADAAWRGN